MEKVSPAEIEKRVQDAKDFIRPGSRWKHYKGGEYVVTDVIVIEATLEIGVLYRPLERPTVTYMRPLITWQDVVNYEGNMAYRFRQISS
jgi:hypothetical protein